MPTFSWKKNSVKVENITRTSYSPDGKRLTISSVQRSDVGYYTCEVFQTSSNTTRLSNKAVLTVHCEFCFGSSMFAQLRLISIYNLTLLWNMGKILDIQRKNLKDHVFPQFQMSFSLQCKFKFCRLPTWRLTISIQTHIGLPYLFTCIE